MAGQPGRSGGHNRISIVDHLKRGTYRRDRHAGQKASGLHRAPAPRSETVRPGLVEGLSERGLGRLFVETCFLEYDGWTPASLLALREAGFLVDALDRLRGKPGEREAQRLLVLMLNVLKFQD
jgi:hypothetical protein